MSETERAKYGPEYIRRSLKVIMTRIPDFTEKVETLENASRYQVAHRSLIKALSMAQYFSIKEAARVGNCSEREVIETLQSLDTEEGRVMINALFTKYPEMVIPVISESSIHAWIDLGWVVYKVKMGLLDITLEVEEKILRALFPHNPDLGECMVKALGTAKHR
jgi:hypothetical protein